MATIKGNTIVGSIINGQVIPSVGMNGGTGSDHQLVQTMTNVKQEDDIGHDCVEDWFALERIKGNFQSGFNSAGDTNVYSETINAVTDIPQSVRSLKFHEKDAVQNVAEILSSDFDDSNLLTRLKIPARTARYSWDPTDASGHLIAAIPVFPGSSDFDDIQDDLYRIYIPTPLTFFGTFYRYYRGSIVVTVEVVCTKLHQGQLFLAFDPTRNFESQTDDAPRDKLRNCPFVVMDISQATRHSQVIPFLSNTDYNVNSLEKINPGDYIYRALGTFYIYVQNPLTAPTTVGGTVDINIYLSAGDDFEFMQPTTTPAVDYYGTSFQADEGFLEENRNVNQSMDIVQKLSQINIVSNVITADTENVLGREYMLRSNVAWKTADPIGKELQSLSMPDEFWQNDFATRGMINYHAYQRMDFELTVRVNPSAFHAGMLLCVWFPGYKEISALQANLGSLTQFSHGFIDLSNQTECTVRAPYSYFSRIMPNYNAPNMGYFSVFVWNALATGSGQPSTLYLTTFARAVNPYVGVKCPVGVLGTTFQMEVGEVQPGISTQINRMYTPIGKNGSGYVQSDHMSLKHLLKRPDYVGTINANIPSRSTWTRVARIPAFCGENHLAIARTYTYWTGTNKIWLVTNLPSNALVNFMCVLNATPYGMKDIDYTTTITKKFPGLSGIVLPRTIDKNTVVVEIPMYRATPLVMTEYYSYDGTYSSDARVEQPVIEVYCNFKAVSTTATAYFSAVVYHSVCDDFQLLQCRAPYKFRQNWLVMDGLIPVSDESPEGDWTITVQGKLSGISTGPFSQTFLGSDSLTLTTSNRNILLDYEGTAATYVASCAIWVKPLIAAHNWKVTVTFTDVTTQETTITIPAGQLLGLTPDIGGTIARPVRFIKFEPVETGYSPVIYGIQVFGQIIPQSITNYQGGYDNDDEQVFPYKNVGGRSSAESGSFANSSQELVKVKMQGVYSTLSEFGASFMEATNGLRELSRLLAQFKNIQIEEFYNWFSRFVTMIFDFIEGMTLSFICNDPVAKAIGLARLTCFAMRLVVAQQLTPPLHNTNFQGGKDLSFKDYIRSFISSIKELLQSHTKYSFEHFSKYVKVCTRLCKQEEFTVEYLFEVITAVVQYVLEGDDVLFRLANTMANDFVESVQNGVTLSNLEELVQTRNTIEQLLIRVRHRIPDVYRVHVRIFEQKVMELETKKQSFDAIPEPIGMYIHADPGVGKSAVMCKILPALLKSWTGDPRPLSEFCVNTSMDSQGRIDKYDGQPIAIFDEFGSNREANEVAVVIKMISQFAETVQTPFLDKKGRSFRSRMVLLLSNLKSIGTFSDKVNNLDAMVRRFHKFTYTMSLRNKGCKFELPFFLEELGTLTTRDQILELLDRTYVFSPFNLMTGVQGPTKEVLFSTIFKDLCHEWTRKLQVFHDGEVIFENIASFQGGNEYFDAVSDCVSSTWLKRLQGVMSERMLFDFCLNFSAELQARKRSDYQETEAELCEYKEIRDHILLKYTKELEEEKLIASFSPDITGFLSGVIKALDERMNAKNGKPYPGLLVWLHKNVKNIAIAASFVATVKIVIWAWRRMHVNASGQSGYEDTRWKIVPKKGTKSASALIESTHHQSLNERHEKIRRNIRKITIADTGYQMSVLCVDNKTLIVNNHFLRKAIGNQVYVSIHASDGSIVDRQPISYAESDVKRVGVETDLSIITLRNATISGARNIRDFFQSKSNPSDTIQATLLSMNAELDMEGTISHTWRVLQDAKTQHVYRACPAFKFQTKNGDCGRPYVIDGNKPIIGIHCAKADSSEVVFFVPIFIEDIPENVIIEYVENQYEVTGKPKEWLPAHCAWGPVKWNDLPLSVSNSPNSSLIPMRRAGLPFAHPDWECDMVPAILRSIGPSGAFAKNCYKYNVLPDFSVPMRCHDMIVNYWKLHYPGKVGRTLDLEEAINGNDKLNPLQWSTSVGWLRETFKEGGKRALFEDVADEPGRKVFSACAKNKIIQRKGMNFIDLLNQQDELLRSGKAIDSPWFATLKDELRSLVKVQACKTRIFENPGLDLTLHIRRYFGDFASWYKTRFGFKYCHGIGANKESEWKTYYDEFMTMVTSDEHVFLDLDYSNYDGSVNEDAFAFFRDITDHFYREDSGSRNARHALLYSISHGHVLINSDLLQTRQGNKSGNPLTDVFNSVTNTYILHVSLMFCQKHVGLGMDPSIIHRQMRLLTYGDDVVLSLSKEVKNWLDLNMLQSLLACFGYTVTDGAKKETLEWKMIDDIQFLKSKFVLYESDESVVVLAPMNKESIYKELFWEKKGHEKDSVIFEQKIETTQQMMAHHGPMEYGIFQKQLRERGVSKKLLSMSWNDRLNNIRDWQRVTAAEVLS